MSAMLFAFVTTECSREGTCWYVPRSYALLTEERGVWVARSTTHDVVCRAATPVAALAALRDCV